jgi:hypothetical protein
VNENDVNKNEENRKKFVVSCTSVLPRHSWWHGSAAAPCTVAQQH